MKYFIAILVCIVACLPHVVQAQSYEFPATVIDVTDTFVRVQTDDDEHLTINNTIQTFRTQAVQPRDRVLITQEEQIDGVAIQFISDFIRYPAVLVAIGFFILAVILLQRKKGLRSLASLVVTLGIVFLAIIPLILRGINPVLVSVVFGSVAMASSIYIAHGWNRVSHIAIATIATILLAIGLLSSFFLSFASLTGLISEEATSLVSLGYSFINLRGLLLAAIIIGTMGVLDDMVFSQLSVITQLQATNPKITKHELFTRAYHVGHDHTTAIINTLVLAYTGAAFPLLILLSLHQPPFDSFTGILNHELVATEIIRTVLGSVGLLLAMPISTYIGVYLFSWDKQRTEKQTTCC